MNAEEFAAQLAGDREYQRAKTAFDKELARRAAVWRAAEVPVVAELRTVGVEVESVWDLVNTAEPYPSALPILIRFLEEGDLPGRVLEGVGRALAVKPSVAFWDRLSTLLLRPSNDDQAEGVAVAMAACATADQVEELISMLNGAKRIPAHVYLLRPILVNGGAAGRTFLESVKADPVLGAEANALLRGRA